MKQIKPLLFRGFFFLLVSSASLHSPSTLAMPWKYIAGKSELDDLIERVYVKFTSPENKKTCTTNGDSEHQAAIRTVCMLKAQVLMLDLSTAGTTGDINLGELDPSYFAQMSDETITAKELKSFFDATLRYTVRVSKSVVGSDGKNYDRLIEVFSNLVSAPSTKLKTIKYWIDDRNAGKRGLIEFIGNDLYLLADNNGATQSTSPELLNADRISWDSTNSSSQTLTWQSVNDGLNGSLTQNSGGWRYYVTAKVNSEANTAELASLSASRAASTGTPGALSYYVLRFYQNRSHSLLRKVSGSSESSGTKYYACVAKGVDPTDSWGTSYAAARAGNCDFAPENESDAFTLTLPASVSSLDLLGDSAGSLWSIVKERTQGL